LKKTNKGDEFKATILNERLATGRILSYDDDERSVLIEILSTKEEEEKEEKMVTVSLLLAMPRPKVLRRLLSVFAQFGVRNVFIFSAEKTERCYFQSEVLTEDVLVREFTRGIEQNALDFKFPNASKCRNLNAVLEALLSSGDEEGRKGREENIAKRVNGKKGANFEWLLRSMRDEEEGEGGEERRRINLLAHPSSASVSVTEALAQEKSAISTNRVEILLAVGPEGGWSEEEVRTFETFDFVNVGLGNRVFTTDVATIALLSSINEYVEYSL
jgi:16S rRNA U1498 N3-methylase RsmE